MINEGKFDDIRPYRDEEVQTAVNKLINDSGLMYMLKKIKSEDEILQEFESLRDVQTIDDFQKKHIANYANNISKMTIDELMVSGMENVKADKKYLFLGNHRDIILDSALLNHTFSENGLPTTEIGLGDNLLAFEWIKDLVKLNRGLIVKRNLQGRQMLQASVTLSEYIYKNITENKRSVWLAQRPGRTKDGNDITHPGLIKMLVLYRRKQIVETINNLHIAPVCISYENEPCGESKILTAYHAEKQIPYQKSAEEDLKSMGRGLLYAKGRVHISIGSPLHIDSDDFPSDMSDNEITEKIAGMIDKKIYSAYKFFPKNYIAYDILHDSKEYFKKGMYDLQAKQEFEQEAREVVEKLRKEDQVIKHIFTRMYAYPLINHRKYITD